MAQTSRIGRTATTVKTENGTTKAQYHNTVVVEFNEKTITLRSGGWRTNTTRTRINQASHQFNLGLSLYQKNFDWYVNYNGNTIAFGEGMQLKRA